MGDGDVGAGNMSPFMSWAPAWEGLDVLIDQKRERLGKILEKHDLN